MSSLEEYMEQLVGDKNTRVTIEKTLQNVGQMFLTDDTFNAHFIKARDFAIKHAVEDNGLSMMFILHGRENSGEHVEIPVLLADWDSDSWDTKETIMRGLGALFVDQNPDCMLTDVVQIAEAWMAQAVAEDVDTGNTIQPSKDPNRVEVIIIDAMSMDQRSSGYQGKILRNSLGNITQIQKFSERLQGKDEDPKYENYLVAEIFKGYYLAKGKQE